LKKNFPEGKESYIQNVTLPQMSLPSRAEVLGWPDPPGKVLEVLA
jgi:hypothetical protein